MSMQERRAPLTPSDAVALLTDSSVQVQVQTSEKRCYGDETYRDAGATVVNNLDGADVICGVKEVPLPEVQAGKTYLTFNHVHKAQAHNLPLLKKMLDSRSRFIDWELLTDESGQRKVAFGYFAGVAGMADGLSCLGTRLLALGADNPFLALPRPYNHASYDDFKHSLARLGDKIRADGTPRSHPAFSVVVTGSGRVARGAIDALEMTNAVRWIESAEALQHLASDQSADRRWIYVYNPKPADYLADAQTGAYDKQAFRAEPTRYASGFAKDIAPFTTMLVNGAFWKAPMPRLLSNDDFQSIRRELKDRGVQKKHLLSIVDIACDFEGGLEFCKRPTTIEAPVCYLDEHAREHAECAPLFVSHVKVRIAHSFTHPNSTQLMTIEILPTHLPRAASEYFSQSALPILRALASPAAAPQGLLMSIEKATICDADGLRPPHAWLSSRLPPTLAVAQPKKVLLLGSGLVAGPVVDLLCADQGIQLTIASDDAVSGSRLSEGRCNFELLRPDNQTRRRSLIGQSDLVISLLPPALHPLIARECIDAGRSMVTASYVSPDMRALHADALSANVLLLNELGLDPGIDSLSAQLLIERIRAEGGTITGYESFCGSLPAPEVVSSDLALPYKFAWSPAGVVSASFLPALYRWNGQDIALSGQERLQNPVRTRLFPSLALEGQANRDSLQYLNEYKLPSDLPSMLRGTLRYAGFSRQLLALSQIGLFDNKTLAAPLKSWPELLLQCLGLKERDEAEIVRRLGATPELVPTLQRLGLWQGLEEVSLPPPLELVSPLRATSRLLAHRLRYLPGERDMVLMSHRIGYRDVSGIDRVHQSHLTDFGDPHEPADRRKHSSVAKTVGWPVALAAQAVLRGVEVRGVQTAVSAELAGSLMRELDSLGIAFKSSEVGVL